MSAPVEQVLADGRVHGPFDTFVLYDVLEHLVDPAAVLEALVRARPPRAPARTSRSPTRATGRSMRDLVLRGTFGYTEWGHRDRTHLRWFTRRDIEALLAGTGWPVVERPRRRSWGARPTLDRLTRRRGCASSWPCSGTSWRSR